MLRSIRMACRYIKRYPQRSMAMILSIALSVFLIVAIGSLNESAKNAQVLYAKNYGAQHVIYVDLNREQVKEVQASPKVQMTAVLAYYDAWNSPKGMRVDLLAADSNILHMENTALKAGRFPGKPGEIALEGWVLDRLRLPHRLGQSLDISLLDRGEKEHFKLVGILEDRMDEKSTGSMQAFVALGKERLWETEGHLNALVEFKEGASLKKEIDALAGEIGMDPNSKEDVLFNEELLAALGQADTVDWELVKISLMLMLVGGMVIFSLYSISVLKRVQEYGMLRAIGATSRQIAWIILWEMAIIYVLGVVPGIAGGAAFIQLFKGYGGDMFIFNATDAFDNVSLSTIVLSGMSVTLALLISLGSMVAAGIRAIRMATGISPLEAINRSTQDARISFPQKEKPFERLLDITQKITLRNLRRNKKAVAFTIIAMSVGSALFMVRAFRLEFFEREAEYYYTDIAPGRNDEFRVNVNNATPMKLGFTWEQAGELDSMPEVEKVTATQMLYSRMEFDRSRLNGEYGKNYIKVREKRLSEFDTKPGDSIKGPEDRQGFAFTGKGKDTLVIRNTVLGLADREWASFSKALVKGKSMTGTEASKPPAIVYIPQATREGYLRNEGNNRKEDLEPVLNLKVGDTIRITYPQKGYEKAIDNWNLLHQYEKYRDQYTDLEFTVAGFTDKLPERDTFYLGTEQAPYVLVSSRVFREMAGIDTCRILSVDMKDGFSEPAYQKIKAKVQETAESVPGTNMQDRVEEMRQDQKARNEYLLFYAAIAAVLITIGGLSIYTNIHYNIISRLREHGILKAVGMTAKQLGKMVRFEGFLYGAMAAFFSCLTALLVDLGTFMYYKYRYSFMQEHFFIEEKSFLLIILVNIGIGCLATLGPVRKINKLPITEAIRRVEL